VTGACTSGGRPWPYARAVPGTEVYLGNLPGSTTEGDLRRCLEQHAGVRLDGVTLVRNARGDARYAFVLVADAAARARLLARCLTDPPRFLGQTLTVGNAAADAARHPTPPPPRRYSPGTAHVFVGGVPWRANADDVHRFLESLTDAAVEHVGIPRDGEGRSRGCAFVRLVDGTDAARVIAAVDGQPFQGRTLRAGPARR
jgi:RNA recognition motif-containing protein